MWMHKGNKMSSKKMWGDGTPWGTENAFWTWMRGGLRRSLWMRHPVKLALLKEKRYRAPLGRVSKSGIAQLVWAIDCSVCAQCVKQSNAEVDHIHEAGSLKNVEDIQSFIERLAFVTSDDLRVVCKPCHKILTYASRYGVSFEEAKKRKDEIAKRKRKKK